MTLTRCQTDKKKKKQHRVFAPLLPARRHVVILVSSSLQDWCCHFDNWNVGWLPSLWHRCLFTETSVQRLQSSSEGQVSSFVREAPLVLLSLVLLWTDGDVNSWPLYSNRLTSEEIKHQCGFTRWRRPSGLNKTSRPVGHNPVSMIRALPMFGWTSGHGQWREGKLDGGAETHRA